MTLKQICDLIIRRVQAAINADDSKFNRLAIEAEIPRWRAKAIIDCYYGTREIAGNKFISPLLLQTEAIDFDSSIQDSGANYVLFKGTAPLQLDEEANGDIFVGDKLTGTPFTQLKGSNYYSIAKDAGLISLDKCYFELLGVDTILVYGNTQLKKIYKKFIAYDPIAVPGFDAEFDFYPVSQDVLDQLIKRAYIDLIPEASRPADKKNDGAETMEMGGTRR